MKNARSSVLSLVAILMLCNCAADLSLEPDRTTYPRDLITTTHVIMPIFPGSMGAGLKAKAGGQNGGSQLEHQDTLVGRPSLEFDQTNVGDTATHVLRATSIDGANSEEALRRGIPDAGRRTCGDEFRVVRTKYYLGKEATSAFMGLKQPWMKIEIRCPLKFDSNVDDLDQLVLKISDQIPEASYFDVNQKEFTISKNKLEIGLRQAIAAQGMSIASEKAVGDATAFVTQRHRAGPIGFPIYEQIVAVVSPSKSGSMLGFRLFAYTRDFEGSSDAADPLGLVPASRNFAFVRSKLFLGKLAAALGQST